VAFFIGARVWASAKLRRLFSSLLVGEEHKIIVIKRSREERRMNCSNRLALVLVAIFVLYFSFLFTRSPPPQRFIFSSLLFS
jgi:hypothetical protein